ncbi:MAG: AtpZ/AtpI family protein [Bryobacterales bacterium]|nr:AtpZ/AtpI family protein [Bryobacterales bacterium]
MPVPFRPPSAAVTAALSLSGTVLGGLLVGAWIGDRWDWNPAAAVAGLFLGILAGFYNLARGMWNQR